MKSNVDALSLYEAFLFQKIGNVSRKVCVINVLLCYCKYLCVASAQIIRPKRVDSENQGVFTNMNNKKI